MDLSSSSSMTLFLLLLPFFTLFLKPCLSETILVDGVAEWENPSVLIGDTIVFKHGQHYNLYIFHTRRGFKECNLTQAVLLTDPKSNTFTWHPSRQGVFYFLFKNPSSETCEESGKLPIVVSPKPETSAPELAPEAAPAPTSGGVVSSSPARQWRFISPTPAEAAVSPMLPGKGGGIPFINSNPAVPLPTEADAATIHPIPISSGNVGQMVGLLSLQIPLLLMAWILFS